MKTEIDELVDTLTVLAKEKYPAIPPKLIERLLEIQSEHLDDPTKASKLMMEAVEESLKVQGKRNA